MKRSLIVISAVSFLVLAGATQGAVRKGDVELEIQGGWLMEKAEQGEVTLTEVEPDSFWANADQVFAGATGADLDSWCAMASLGVFTSPNFQVAIAGFYTQLEGDPETYTFEDYPGVSASYGVDMTMYGVGGRGRWHFNPGGKWVPFVGVQGFWVSADIDVTVTSETLADGVVNNSPSGILWGPLAGLRCQLGANDALTLEYQYHMWAGDLDDVLQEGHGFFVGLAHRLK